MSVACPLHITLPILSRSVLLLSKSRDTDVPLLFNSKCQNFPDFISWYQNFPHRFQYFPTPSTKTFQIKHLGTKTFHIGSNTFQFTVPTLSKSYITVPKLSRSAPILSNSQYQNFPIHGTKNFQFFSWLLYPR